MNTLIRPALYGAYHRIIPLGNAAERTPRITDLTGQICENTDRIARDREFPELQVGDLIAILDTGAYGFSLASQYNGHPLPAEVLVEGAETHLIRRRETQEDLNRNVVIPDYLKD
jgi:diaminopimelate decarboxylase